MAKQARVSIHKHKSYVSCNVPYGLWLMNYDRQSDQPDVLFALLSMAEE